MTLCASSLENTYFIFKVAIERGQHLEISKKSGLTNEFHTLKLVWIQVAKFLTNMNLVPFPPIGGYGRHERSQHLHHPLKMFKTSFQFGFSESLGRSIKNHARNGDLYFQISMEILIVFWKCEKSDVTISNPAQILTFFKYHIF